MLSVRREGVRRQHGEVSDVAGHTRPSLSGGVRELGSIIALGVADMNEVAEEFPRGETGAGDLCRSARRLRQEINARALAHPDALLDEFLGDLRNGAVRPFGPQLQAVPNGAS